MTIPLFQYLIACLLAPTTRRGPVYRLQRTTSSRAQTRNPQFVGCVSRTTSACPAGTPAGPQGLGAPRAKRSQSSGLGRSGRSHRAKRTQYGPHRPEKATTAGVARGIGFVFASPCCACPSPTPFLCRGYAHFNRRQIGFVPHNSPRRAVSCAGLPVWCSP